MIIENLTIVLDSNFIWDSSCYFSLKTTTLLTRPLNIPIVGLNLLDIFRFCVNFLYMLGF